MRMLRLISLFLLTLAAAANAAAQDDSDTDFQFWNETQLIIPLDERKRWNLALSATGRFGDNVSQTVDARIGFQVTRRINSNITVGGGYLYRYSNPTLVRRRYENRYLGILTLTVPLSKDKKWAIVNRNMLQYEDRYSRPNNTVMRNRAWLRREVSIGGKKFDPFVSLETTFDLSRKEIVRYRTQAGVTRRFNSSFAADIFYVRQDDVGGDSLNGIGTGFRFNL